MSSGLAPVLLIGGWTVAASRQLGGFDQSRETISALAAHGADDRWLMTGALVGLGLCHMVTAAALRPAAVPGRLVLALGGIATVLVAIFPLPSGGSGSPPHTAAAAVAFLALAAWPLLASSAGGPAMLRQPASVLVGSVLLGLVGWFAVELAAGSDQVGLAERVAAGAQALWPLAVVLTTRYGRSPHGL